ncbi:MAG: hypothetical protein IJ985_02640, partial [Akkermansia sp.]|nr:hypothetical protein [Akkermansia sp.]
MRIPDAVFVLSGGEGNRTPVLDTVDIYASDGDGKWRFVKQGRIRSAKTGGSLTISWKPGTQCLVNLPLYNGIAS